VPDSDDDAVDTAATDTGDDEQPDTDSDTDEDTDEDTDTGPDLCMNPWDPVDASGWTKDYSGTYEGSPATFSVQGLGAGTTSDGAPAYLYQEVVTAGMNGYTATVYVGCDADALSILGWDAQHSLGNFQATHSAPRLYLPAPFAMGGVGSWTYDSTAALVQAGGGGGGGAYTLHVQGTVTEYGLTQVDLFDGSTVEAYKLANAYAYKFSDSSGFLTYEGTGTIDQWWAEGLGLVEELNKDADGQEVGSRSLTGYTGL
jgi:hypothetical protein